MLSSFVLKVCHVRTHSPHLFFYIKPYFCAPSFFSILYFTFSYSTTQTPVYMDFFFPLTVSFCLPFILTHFYYSFFFAFFLHLICFYLYSSSSTKPLLSSSLLFIIILSQVIYASLSSHINLHVFNHLLLLSLSSSSSSDILLYTFLLLLPRCCHRRHFV